MSNLSPFPNQGEIIRYLAVAMDLKAGNKALDEYVRDGDTDFRRREKLVDEVFFKRLAPGVGEHLAGFFRQSINGLLDTYILLVKQQSVDGVPRSLSLPMLVSNFFSWSATELVVELTAQISGPQSLICLIIPGYSAIKAVVAWLEQNVAGWQQSYENWTKEQKDRLRAWCKGDDLPSYTNIQLVVDWLKKGGASLTESVGYKIRCLLLMARMFEWVKKAELGEFAIETMNEFMWAQRPRPDFERELAWLQYEHNKKYEDLSKLALALHDSLSLRREKPNDAKEQTRHKLVELKKRQKQIDPEGHTKYYINWLEARWYLLSGELKESLAYYKKAFEQCLYTAGENQQGIIEQSLVVAAIVGDKPFLKRLKNQAIVFGWFVESTVEDDSALNNKRSRSRSNVVEDWEVDIFKNSFNKYLSERALFEDCSIEDYVPKPREIKAINHIEPDYRHPNKKFKLWTLTRQKISPQLVCFAEMGDLEVVQKLLQNRASVNVHSDSGDTPLLMAVQEMNVTNVPYTSLNDSCFKMITGHNHESRIVNMRTTKKKLLPLICAVYSGRPWVVRKLLDMGAEVDRRGETDLQTALHVTIGLIMKKLDKSWAAKELIRHFHNPNEPELESMRRHAEGLTGFTIEHQLIANRNQMNNEEYQVITTTMVKLMAERVEKELSLSELREIAAVLLDACADPDAEHDSAIKGYTPLMLTVEIDEVEVFEKMLNCGGSPYKTYVCPRSKRNIDCWEIARHFGAAKIQHLLKEKYPSR